MTPEFWDDFVATYWKTKPHLFKGAQAIATADDGLALIRGAFQRIIEAIGTPTELALEKQCRFYIEGRLAQPPEMSKFFPAGETLAEYFSIVSERLGGAEFGIVINSAHSLLPSVFYTSLELIQPFIERIGIPASDVEVGFFGGTYKMTPFGIHHDTGNSVWTFPVLGRKRFLLWPPGHFSDNPLAVIHEPDPAIYEKDALVFDAGEGDMLFWPDDWMHVAHDRAPRPHAAFSIGTWSQANMQAQLTQCVQEFMERRLEPKTFTGQFARSKALPSLVQETLTSLEKSVRDGDFRRFVEERWSNRVDDFGFGKAHKPR